MADPGFPRLGGANPGVWGINLLFRRILDKKCIETSDPLWIPQYVGTEFIGFKTSITSGRKEPHNTTTNRHLVILRAIIISTQTIFERPLTKENILAVKEVKLYYIRFLYVKGRAALHVVSEFSQRIIRDAPL